MQLTGRCYLCGSYSQRADKYISRKDAKFGAKAQYDSTGAPQAWSSGISFPVWFTGLLQKDIKSWWCAIDYYGCSINVYGRSINLYGCFLNLYGCFINLYGCFLNLYGCFLNLYGCFLNLYGCFPQSLRMLPQSLRLLPQSLRLLPQSLRMLPQALRMLHQSLRLLHQSLRELPQSLRLLHQCLRVLYQSLRVFHQSFCRSHITNRLLTLCCNIPTHFLIIFEQILWRCVMKSLKRDKKNTGYLPGEQKDMLLLFISSMTDQAETKHHTLQEPQVDYESGNLPSCCRQLGSEQREALLLLIRSLVLQTADRLPV